MTVTLRQRKKGKKINLYLDYYSKGKRYFEFLRLYLFIEPEKGRLTKLQKEANRMKSFPKFLNHLIVSIIRHKANLPYSHCYNQSKFALLTYFF